MIQRRSFMYINTHSLIRVKKKKKIDHTIVTNEHKLIPVGDDDK